MDVGVQVGAVWGSEFRVICSADVACTGCDCAE